MQNQNNRYYALIRWKLGIDATTIQKELKSALNTQAPAITSVFRWVSRFKAGKFDLNDQPRCGAPITARKTANIEKVRLLIDDDPYITYKQIEATTSLHSLTIHSIIHDDLKLRKITSSRVPHNLSKKNKEDRVAICKENLAKFNKGKWRLSDVITGDGSWFYYCVIKHKQCQKNWVGIGKKPRFLLNREQAESKTMFTIFHKSTGVVHISHLESGKTIDNNLYRYKCLYPLMESIHVIRPKFQ